MFVSESTYSIYAILAISLKNHKAKDKRIAYAMRYLIIIVSSLKTP